MNIDKITQYCSISLVPRHSPFAHSTRLGAKCRDVTERGPRCAIRWRHEISRQVESSEREENAWALGWETTRAGNNFAANCSSKHKRGGYFTQPETIFVLTEPRRIVRSRKKKNFLVQATKWFDLTILDQLKNTTTSVRAYFWVYPYCANIRSHINQRIVRGEKWGLVNVVYLKCESIFG